MPRPKRKLLMEVKDIDGDLWSVYESRPTNHGWPVLLGRPDGARGPAANAIILTRDLADHLTRHRRDKRLDMLDLPEISHGAIKVLRKRLGLNRYDDARAFFETRTRDLGSLTSDEFARKHGVTAGAAEHWRLQLVGKVLRDPGWYLDEGVVEALKSDLSATDIAAFIGQSKGSAGRLRCTLRKRGLMAPATEEDTRRRMSLNAHARNWITAKQRATAKRLGNKPKTKEHKRHISMGLKRFWREQPRPGVIAGNKRWTKEEDRLLGRSIDSTVALQTGRSIAAVRGRRKRLGIPESNLAKRYRLKVSKRLPRRRKEVTTDE
jgi:hypothetical protein